MGFFLHIPFPAPEVFTALPQHQRLARGLCAFDLVGFQTERDTANFRRYLVEHRWRAVVLDDGQHPGLRPHASRADTFSIGIDPDDIAALAEGEEGRAAADRLGRHHRATARWSSASTAWTIPRACRSAWRPSAACSTTTQELHGRVSFLQIAPPSREAVDAYQVLREELDRLAGRINADYADLDWMPIRYLARSYSRGALCRPLPPRPRRPRHAAPRRHEPRRQGVRRRAGPRRPRRARALRVRRRRRAAAGGAPRQPARHRRHRRRHLPRALDAARGAPRALAGR